VWSEESSLHTYWSNSPFSRLRRDGALGLRLAARGSAEAAERLAALWLAQTVLEEAAAPEALAIAAEEMGAERAGREDGFVWRVVLAPHEGAPEDGPPVIALTASVGAPGAPPLVTLRTARALR
jgi:hypothetical protein